MPSKKKAVTQPLIETLQKIPQDLFWKKMPGGVPSYKGAMSYVMTARYPSGVIPIVDIIKDDFPNPSTLQRLVAKEANRRRKLLGEWRAV